ncbi:Lipolytic enzyme [Mycena kentingensis (nom. inval.)]|nr:Lipolytic enzyme [Mycena kentingensis (nom. inval.)]
MLKSFLVLASFSAAAVAQQVVWGQCGGMGWTGPTTCVSGTTCVFSNPWYSQCLPGAATTTPPATTTTPATTPPATTTVGTAPPAGTTGLSIRLLPLGDSITFGLASSDGNGYRNTLHNALASGNTVDFIGSVKAGSMADNDNEGHSGATISQIAGFATNALALPRRPNVVLLMAGTNDVALNSDLANAPTRLFSLVDTIFRTCPDATVVVATLTPLFNQAAINSYNTNVTATVARRATSGQHILLASMAAIASSDLADGVHPNNNGYVKMANAWLAAVQQAGRNGWIRTPV